MNRVTAKIRATQRAMEMYFSAGSWNREISRFAIASPDSPQIFRINKKVKNGHDILKGQNTTGLMCSGGM